MSKKKDDLLNTLGTIVEIFEKHRDALFREVGPILEGDNLLEMALDDSRIESEKRECLLKKNDQLLSKIKKVCVKYDKKKLLYFTRTIPYAFVQQFYSGIFGDNSPNESRDIYRTNLLASNAILRYSVFHSIDKFEIQQLVLDSYRLIMWCMVRRMINSVHHFYCIYNNDERSLLVKRSEVKIERPIISPDIQTIPIVDKRSIINLEPVGLKRPEANQRCYWAELDRMENLELYNYFVLFHNCDAFFIKYKGLEDYGMNLVNGVSFHKLREAFCFLNQFISDRLIAKNQDQTLVLKNGCDIYKFLFLFFLGTNGLIQMTRKELLKYFRRNSQRVNDLSTLEFIKVIDSLTMNIADMAQIDIDVTENRFLFYQLEKNNLVWDVCQHKVIFDALERHVANGGEAGNIKGKAFEDYVQQKLLQNQCDYIQGLKRNVIIYSNFRLKLLDIDIGFVYRNVLYLIEIKSYVLKKGEISGKFYKGKKLIKQLRKYDGILSKHQDKIYFEWRGTTFTKSVYVMILSSFQEIPLTMPDLWLVEGSIPRICLLEDFLKYLQSLNSTPES